MSTLVAVGSIAYDSLETPFGRRDRALGGSAVHFSLAARLLPRDVRRELPPPERCVALRLSPVLRTAVPETPVDEDCHPNAREDDVGRLFGQRAEATLT